MGFRKTIKILHTLFSAGLIGGLAAHMILLITVQQETVADYTALRASLEAISSYVLVPSLGGSLISGLIAMAAHKGFHDMGWVWVKFLMGLPLFQGTLVHLAGQARHAEIVAERAVNEGDVSATLDSAMATEWLGLWTIMVLCIAQVAIGVWRPRLVRPRAKKTTTKS